MVRQMSEEHRLANQKARAENSAVSAYLSALLEHKPRRGRQRTKESMQNRLDEITSIYDSSTPLKKIQLIQERMNLEKELAMPEVVVNWEELEAGFAPAAASYSKRKGITYAAWREIGVPAAVLKRAGISRAASR